ncbi:MAG: hypothetical protein ACRDOE_17745, partial [Streptosporangiaceae bacterium]
LPGCSAWPTAPRWAGSSSLPDAGPAGGVDVRAHDQAPPGLDTEGADFFADALDQVLTQDW